MNKLLFIPKQDVIELLEKAFDAGWGGFRDLKEGTVSALLQDYIDEKKKIHAERGVKSPVEIEPAFVAEETNSSDNYAEIRYVDVSANSGTIDSRTMSASNNDIILTDTMISNHAVSTSTSQVLYTDNF
jgi:hypothetical protein